MIDFIDVSDLELAFEMRLQEAEVWWNNLNKSEKVKIYNLLKKQYNIHSNKSEDKQ